MSLSEKRATFTGQHICVFRFAPSTFDHEPIRPMLIGQRFGIFFDFEKVLDDDFLRREFARLSAPSGLSEFRGVVTIAVVGDPVLRGTFERLPDHTVSAFVLKGRF